MMSGTVKRGRPPLDPGLVRQVVAVRIPSDLLREIRYYAVKAGSNSKSAYIEWALREMVSRDRLEYGPMLALTDPAQTDLPLPPFGPKSEPGS